ncbi:hypothetical protein LCGC14_2071750 [marine sediment metagenome]|uniref:Uncharacterized protein n=1 Tax=marine sediment metagenome TaxID=412755 RepID=A0A0F9EI65_9ZZZZ
MPDIDELRQALLFEEIAKRLARGDTARTIGRELNIRPDVIRSILASDVFLAVLRDHDRDLADSIVKERDAAKPLPYEELIIAEAVKSVEVLRDLRDSSEDDKVVIAASTALVNVAEKIKKVHVEKTTVRVTFPKKQLEALIIAGQEVNALERYAEPDAGVLGIDNPSK